MEPQLRYKKFAKIFAYTWGVLLGVLLILNFIDSSKTGEGLGVVEVFERVIFIVLLWAIPVFAIRFVSLLRKDNDYKKVVKPIFDSMKTQYQNEAVFLCDDFEDLYHEENDKELYQIRGDNLNSILAPGMQLELPDASLVTIHEVYATGDLPDPYLPVGAGGAVCFWQEETYEMEPFIKKLANENVLVLKIINPSKTAPQPPA